MHSWSVVHIHDVQSGPDLFHMLIAKTSSEYNRDFELVGDKDCNEIRSRYDLKHELKGNYDQNSLTNCVVDVRRVLDFMSYTLHDLRYLTQPYKTEIDFIVNDGNETLRWPYL